MSYETDIQNKEVIAEEIFIGHPKAKFASAISSSTLKNCEVTIIGSSNTLLSHVVFDNCTINCKRASSHIFKSVKFIHCKFVGLLKDSVIGSPDLDSDGFDAEIRDCDFTELEMNLVDFRQGLALTSCKWPSWPHVVFERTNDTRQALKQLKLPKQVSRLIGMRVLGNKNYLVFNMSKYDCDLESIHKTLSGSPHVFSN